MKGKYTVQDIEKGLNHLKKSCQALYVTFEIADLGRLEMKAVQSDGNSVTVIVFDESTAKMPEVTRTERL